MSELNWNHWKTARLYRECIKHFKYWFPGHRNQSAGKQKFANLIAIRNDLAHGGPNSSDLPSTTQPNKKQKTVHHFLQLDGSASDVKYCLDYFEDFANELGLIDSAVKIGMIKKCFLH